jgi:hypothetical protein
MGRIWGYALARVGVLLIAIRKPAWYSRRSLLPIEVDATIMANALLAVRQVAEIGTGRSAAGIDERSWR